MVFTDISILLCIKRLDKNKSLRFFYFFVYNFIKWQKKCMLSHIKSLIILIIGKSRIKNVQISFLIISFISISFSSSAETIEIDMVNKLGKEKMVYSIKVAKIDIGDTIIWKSVDKGHNVEFVEMPKGVKKFKSKISKDGI